MTLKTRKGLDWTAKYPAIAAAGTALPDCIIDGEICALDEHGAPDFAALQASLSEGKTGDLVFFGFDLLFDAGDDICERPLTERKVRLQALLDAAVENARLRFVEHFDTGGDAVLKSACQLSLEGIVSKKADAPYRSGRTDTWAKSKCRAGHEVVIGGWAKTSGKFRSLLVGVHRGAKFAYVGRVGTGYAAQKLRMLLPKLDEVAAKTSPFTGAEAPKKDPDVVWVKPELVAEIEFAGWTAHELATNSLKYGALSVGTGTLDESGTMVDNDVEIIWSEQGGPEVVAPTGPGGYGSKLVQRTLASRSVVRYQSTGKRVGFRRRFVSIVRKSRVEAVWPIYEGTLNSVQPPII